MRNSYTNSYRDSYTVGIKPAHPERHPDPGTVPEAVNKNETLPVPV